MTPNTAKGTAVVHNFANPPVDNRTWLWIKPRGENKLRDPRLSRTLDSWTNAAP
ncbi:hypothetical protein SHJG_5126 [Streptomyces hygroscopicus subsp. jinggangensis 5008]|nr:hypothetical protein SHJG_5126 [Streptomyces hygroscopicus subsp. jinggangensis 5008]AGF64552.1 hypothetical protein SHJGH_4889 [Streptomyces hygroscopicus subsp. jinggangensis TL01]